MTSASARPGHDHAPHRSATGSQPSLEDARAALVQLVERWGAPEPASAAQEGTLTTIPTESATTWGFSWPQVPQARPSAVLILFGALDEVPAACTSEAVHPDVDVLLTQRADSLRTHAGQVAFPGGRMDPEDEDVVATALREAEEETGLDPAGVEVLGVLPPLPVSVSGYVLHPVIGWWREPSRVAVVDRAEATAVFRVPVADLVAPENRFTVARPGGRKGITPGFAVQDRFVWGVTAAILDRILHLLEWDIAWDKSVVLDAQTRRPVED